VQDTDVQDESIRELASTLREMLGTAYAIPDLPEIPNTTSVIDEIGRQSLQVASLIHEYTKLPWAGNYVPLLLGSVNSNNVAFVVRTLKIQIPNGLKSRIAGCQKNCAYLKDRLSNRIWVDTNTQVHHNSMFLLGVGRTLEAIKDDKLGTFKFLFSLITKIIRSIPQRKRLGTGYPHLIAPGIVMKRTKNVKSTLAPGFSTESDSLSGKKNLVFFGLWERVSLSESFSNSSVK
jgi:hypothetical protein